MPAAQLVRVYLPLTSSGLRRAKEAGAFPEAPLPAHAVTPTLEHELGDGDQEECEYAALKAAAAESWSLRGPGDAPRCLVAAVDVPRWEPRAAAWESAVLVPATVPMRRLAALHVGDERDQQDGADEDGELGWFAAQELDDVLDALAG